MLETSPPPMRRLSSGCPGRANVRTWVWQLHRRRPFALKTSCLDLNRFASAFRPACLGRPFRRSGRSVGAGRGVCPSRGQARWSRGGWHRPFGMIWRFWRLLPLEWGARSEPRGGQSEMGPLRAGSRSGDPSDLRLSGRVLRADAACRRGTAIRPDWAMTRSPSSGLMSRSDDGTRPSHRRPTTRKRGRPRDPPMSPVRNERPGSARATGARGGGQPAG